MRLPGGDLRRGEAQQLTQQHLGLSWGPVDGRRLLQGGRVDVGFTRQRARPCHMPNEGFRKSNRENKKSGLFPPKRNQETQDKVERGNREKAGKGAHPDILVGKKAERVGHFKGISPLQGHYQPLGNFLLQRPAGSSHPPRTRGRGGGSNNTLVGQFWGKKIGTSCQKKRTKMAKTRWVIRFFGGQFCPFLAVLGYKCSLLCLDVFDCFCIFFGHFGHF